MFRDSKEYQEIAKIYAERVSKPENLDEMGPLGLVKGKTKITPFKDTSMGKGEKVKITPFKDTSMGKGEKVKVTPFKDTSMGKPDGAKVDTSSEIESSSAEFKANEGDKVNQRFKKDVGIVRRSQMTGKERAQAIAKKRIESGKTIQQVKDENKASMRARAAEKNKKYQAAKKAGPEAMKKYREENPKLSGKERAQAMARERIAAKKRLSDANIKVEDYTPYDIVLEYLLSSKQAATIEEANYIMTEMDAKTIQSIVAE